jgi:hypothetical protein
MCIGCFHCERCQTNPLRDEHLMFASLKRQSLEPNYTRSLRRRKRRMVHPHHATSARPDLLPAEPTELLGRAAAEES